ncbi:MAG: ATP-binding protein [Nitrospirae bacterium YQR-1]
MERVVQIDRFSIVKNVLLWLIIISALYVSSLYGYLVFHTFAEMFSIVIAFSIFIIAHNTRSYMQNNYLYFIGITYLFVGSLDALHTLAYKGMNIIHGRPAATEIWIATRYIESISLLIAPFFLYKERIRPFLIYSVYTLITLLILTSIFIWNNFPVCYVQGVGLTAFKKISEYIICSILVASLILLFKNKRFFDNNVLKLLSLSISFATATELCFTLYVGVYDFMNLLGHMFKVISYYFTYKAIIVTGMTKPFDLLFRDLNLSNKANMERAEEISIFNKKLTNEIARRKKVEDELISLNKHLERRVDEEVEKLRQKEMLLIQQSKMALMGEMIAAISHQWRQPLTIISFLIQDMEDAYRHGELDSKYVDTTVSGTMRQIGFMSKTIDDFRDFFKPAKEKETFDMIEIAGEVFSLFSSQLKNVTYRITCHAHNKTFTNFSEVVPCGATVITTYKSLLAHVILNIIKNSNDAIMERENRGLPAAAQQHGMIMVDCYRNDNILKMEISDNAGGIPDNIMETIFDPYFTTKSSGTGIGLYLSKIIMEDNLNGRISVRNTATGAKFTLEFNV